MQYIKHQTELARNTRAYSQENFQETLQQLGRSDSNFGGACLTNEECKNSSWCCSGGHCVPGSTCYHGSKIITDFCENNYECLSRCCHKETCSKFTYCAQTCKINSECNTECCSIGYCTTQNVCEGHKADGDVCDKSSECSSQKCLMDKNHNKLV